MPALRVEVLGPVRVLVDGRAADVRGERRTAVLALLALAGGRTVPFETLIDSVWADEPPSGARQALHSLLSRLRAHLGPAADRLERDGGGYRLRLHQGELDVAEVRAAAAEARAIAPTDPARAAELFAAALGAWRGSALADLGAFDALAADVVALTELRLRLEEEHLEAMLAAGRVAELVEPAATMATAHPTREARQLLLMRVLARDGRAAEALRAGSDYRRLLAEQTGLEPTPALTLLESRIASGAEAPAPPPARPAGDAAATPPADPPHPALRSGALPPRFRTPLLGRERELAELHELLRCEPLLTVVGLPGVGKTRLAAEAAATVAESDPGSVTFVGLAAVGATTSLADTVSGALGVRVGPGQTPLAAMVERLAVDRHLLVLDNCEHVLGAVRDLAAQLLSGCPGLTVLLTSRVPSGLPGECVIRLPPLESAGDSPAVQLFIERAGRVRRGFTAEAGDHQLIADIVRRLDGLPLAIELAAARLSTLSLRDLAPRLDSALDLLAGPVGDGGTGAARHRTLRSTLDWSYQLLDEPQRLLLRHLAAFADGADLAAVETVADAVGLATGGAVELAALVDASLVDAQLDGEPRYRMLETVRSLAHGRQTAVPGESDRARAVMIRWAVDAAAEIDAVSRTPAEPRADRRLRRELGNFRAAHYAALESGDLDSAVALTVSLDLVASLRDMPEVWAWATRLAGWPDVEEHEAYVDVLGAAAEAAWLQGDLVGAEALAETGLAIGRPCARCMHALAAVSMFRGQPTRGVELWRQAAEMEPQYLASASLAAGYADQVELAWELHDVAAAWAAEHGSTTDIAWAHYAGAEITSEGAVARYDAAIELSRQAGSAFVEGVATVGLAAQLAATGREDDALERYETVVRYWQGTGNWTQQWTTLRNLAVLLARRGDDEVAGLITASAAAAPEASADLRASTGEIVPGQVLSRSEVVVRALGAIARQRGASP